MSVCEARKSNVGTGRCCGQVEMKLAQRSATDVMQSRLKVRGVSATAGAFRGCSCLVQTLYEVGRYPAKVPSQG